MRDEEAIDYLLGKIKLLENQELTICDSPDFPQYKYLDVVDRNTRKPHGGSAYVIDIEDNSRIYVVPNEMPPHFNMRSVEADDALELT